MSRVPALLSVLFLAACTQATPTAVLSPEPLGQASKTGEFANINVEPKGQTVQMTPAERDQAKAELAGAGRQAAAQKQSAEAKGASDAEIQRLRQLALAERKRRLAEIAGNNRLN